jgi:hypothetical protein
MALSEPEVEPDDEVLDAAARKRQRKRDYMRKRRAKDDA